MLKIFRKNGILLVLASLLLLVTACGASGGSSSKGSSSTSGNSSKSASATANSSGGSKDFASFFKGKTVIWLVPYKPGGGYDTYSRMIAPYFGKYLGGANVIVQNMPSAGGLVDYNTLFHKKPDGLTVGIVNGPGAAAAQLANYKGVQFHLLKFSYLGRIMDEPQVIFTKYGSPLTEADLFDKGRKPLRYATTGPGSTEYLVAKILKDYANANFDIITGFQSSKDFTAAVERGDADISSTSVGSAIKQIDSKQLKPILTSDFAANSEVPKVATYSNLKGISADGKKVLEGQVNLFKMGRPVAAPPGVPQDKLDYMSAAFSKVMHDPQFLAQAKKAKRSISFVSGKDYVKIVEGTMNASDTFKKVLIETYATGK